MKDISEAYVVESALPCPFCGGAPQLELVDFYENAPAFYRLGCTGPAHGTCEIGPAAAARTRVATLTQWNKRSNTR